MKNTNRIGNIIFLLLVGLDFFVWYEILFRPTLAAPEVYFLEVGQGDSELVRLPPNVSILTDAGPDGAILRDIEPILGATNRYIDLAIVSHPQRDHFNGFNYLLERYSIGAFLVNGRSAPETIPEWRALEESIGSRRIPVVVIRSGDRIRYKDSTIEIVGPPEEYLGSSDLNDTGIIERIVTPEFITLLTADIGIGVERFLLERKANLRAHVLKIPHHGSKYSSSAEFLRAVNPLLAIVEVGRGNRYGHPAPETLSRIASSTNAKILRTDQNGTIRVFAEKGALKAVSER